MGGPPLTSLEIMVNGPLERLANGNAAKELADEVGTAIGTLARHLCLTTDSVDVRVSTTDSGRPLRVLVNGRSAPYPPDLLWQLSMDQPDGGPNGRNGSGASIADDCLAAHCGDGKCMPADVARLVVSMIRNRPALLVDDAEAASFATASEKVVSQDALRDVLASLLDLGVAPWPRRTVIEALAANENRVEDSVEAAFAARQAESIEIRVSPKYRAVLSGAGSPEPTLVSESAIEPTEKELFVGVEERLLVEWGLVPPDIVWSTDHGLDDGLIVIKVNDRLSPPYRGLDKGEELLLGDPTGNGSAKARTKRRLRNPASAGLILTVVDSAGDEQIDGQVAAGPAAFAALIVYREIIANAHRLISTEQTLYLLQDLERRAPHLVHLVLRHFTVAQITQVLRALVRERIPPRLLPVILERFARLLVRPVAANKRAEFVRRGLHDYVMHRFARGALPRRFFELSPEIEEDVASSVPDDLYAERLRDAVWSTLSTTGVPPVLAALLVHKAPRDLVFELLAPELPELVVIRRKELGAEVLDSVIPIEMAAD